MRRRFKPKNPRKPELNETQILDWADAFHDFYGWWPKEGGFPQAIAGTLGEKWKNVDDALRKGNRGLTGGSSLALLLARHRGVRNTRTLPRLQLKQILAWADAFNQKTGRWPRQSDWYEVIEDSSGEKWMYIDHALQHGARGLAGGSSLAQLLAEKRGIRNKGKLPHLTVRQILKWADAFYRKTDRWPTCRGCGEIENSGGETWFNVDQALRKGLRGLAGDSSLAQLFSRHRGVRNTRSGWTTA